MTSDSQARKRIQEDLDTSLAVDAGAGTGKTTLLIDRLLGVLLKKRVPLPRVAAITFTDKAAGELIERLRSRLEEELDRNEGEREVLQKALEDLEQASICTIHSFCASILREYPVEAGADPRFVVLDQVQSEALETRAWEDWLKKALAKEVPALSLFLKLGGSFGQVEKLKGTFLKYRSLLGKPEARPLPGPEGLLPRLEAFLDQTLPQLGQCRSEKDKLFKTVMELRAQAGAVDRMKPEERVPALALLEIPSTTKLGSKESWDDKTLKALRVSLQVLKEAQEGFAGQVKDAALSSLGVWLWDYLDAYDRAKGRGGSLDFDDLLAKTRDLLKGNRGVREEMKKRYSRLFVDEFQDTDPLQVEIVFFLCEKPGKQAADWEGAVLSPGKLFLVGDPQQSIYRFRRADVEIYAKARAKLEASGGRVERLTQNFRTLDPIVRWVNGRFQRLFKEGTFPYSSQTAERKGSGDKAALPPLTALTLPEVPEAHATAEGFRVNEAEAVAAFLQKAFQSGWTIEDTRTKKTRPLTPGDTAILLRELTNAEEVYEEALRKRGVPYRLVGGKRFYNRPEIAVLETLLSVLDSPADEALVAAALRSPLFGFPDEELFLHRSRGGSFEFLKEAPGKLGEAFRSLRLWRGETRLLSPADTLLYLYDRTNLLSLVASQSHGEQRVANLLKVVDQCRDLESSQNFTYRAFVRWLARQREEEAMEGEAPGPEGAEDQVTLMTLHKAKGLEFPFVVLSGIGRDKPRPPDFVVSPGEGRASFKMGDKDLELWTKGFPEAQAREAAQEQAELLRLLYVGVTRAKDGLVIPTSQQEGAAPFLTPLFEEWDGKAFRTVLPSDASHADPPALVVELKEEEKTSPGVLEKEKEIARWREGRKALVEKRRGQKQLRSVTSLAHSDDDKSLREGLRLEEPSGSESAGASEGKAFGILAHKLLEKGWDWDKGMLQKAARLWAPFHNITSETADQTADLAWKALGSDLLKRAKASPRLFRELSLTGKGPEGFLLNAVIDLAFLEGEEWVVVDYKTDKEIKDNLTAYQKQLHHYGQLLESFTNHKVKETCLYFLRHDRVEKV